MPFSSLGIVRPQRRHALAAPRRIASCRACSGCWRCWCERPPPEFALRRPISSSRSIVLDDGDGLLGRPRVMTSIRQSRSLRCGRRKAADDLCRRAGIDPRQDQRRRLRVLLLQTGAQHILLQLGDTMSQTGSSLLRSPPDLTSAISSSVMTATSRFSSSLAVPMNLIPVANFLANSSTRRIEIGRGYGSSGPRPSA